MDSKWSEAPGSSGTLGEHFEQNKDRPNQTTVDVALRDTLTPRQRMVLYINAGLANDLDRGSKSEQWTAALLHIVIDALAAGYTPELVAVVQAWRQLVQAGKEEG